MEKYLINLQLRLPSAGFQNIVWYTNAVINIVYTLYSKRIYLARSLSIAATKTVDCSFIEAEHSTQEKILVLPNISPYHHLFHKVSIFHLLNSHKFLHIYCLQRSVLPTSKNTVFESCKTTSLLLFCFHVLFYRINTHALKNAFQLQNNSMSI